MNSSGDHIMSKRGVNAMTRRDMIVGGTAALAVWTSASCPLAGSGRRNTGRGARGAPSSPNQAGPCERPAD